MQRLGRRLELVDLVGGEGVAGLLGPVGLAVEHVVVEAELSSLLCQPGRGVNCFAAHQDEPDEPCELAVLPKPPRGLVVDGGRAAARGRRVAEVELEPLLR